MKRVIVNDRIAALLITLGLGELDLGQTPIFAGNQASGGQDDPGGLGVDRGGTSTPPLVDLSTGIPLDGFASDADFLAWANSQAQTITLDGSVSHNGFGPAISFTRRGGKIVRV